MAISRATKTEKVTVLTKELATSTSAIVGTFSGLTASKDFDLRKTVRAAGASYHVVKNKLAAKASEGSKIEAALQGLKGVSAVAYTSGDPVELAKALSNWVKDNSEFSFKLAIVDGKVLNVSEIAELATMPGKEELFSKLLFLIQSPAQRLATVLNATGRDLAVVLGQGVEKEKFAAGASAAPAAEASAPTMEAPAAPVEKAATTESAPAAASPEVAAPEAKAPDAEAATPETADPKAPEAEAQVAEAPVEAASVAEAAPEDSTAETGAGETVVGQAEPEIAAAHAEEAPTPEELIREHPEAEADAVAETPETGQPENGTASQAGEAANTEPVEG